jgi:predicted MFS family arabinose efflux permease
MTLTQRLTPEGQLNEGMTLTVTALLAGIATGSATAGWLIDHTSPTTAYATPATAAALALLACALGVSRKNPPAAEDRPDPED